MIYGRVEPDGLRCMYHGWLFDPCGKVLLRGEWLPEKERRWDVGQPAYPCTEAGGIIFTYMGPGVPPVLPAYEFLGVAPENRAVTKIAVGCNYLQANEGNIDPLHLSFLHRNLRDSERDKRRTVPGSSATPNALVSKDPTPVIEVDITEFGLRIYTIRKPDDGKQYLRVTNFIYPNLAAFNGSTTGAGYSAHWHVPIDDHSHWKYAFIFSRERPLSQDLRERWALKSPAPSRKNEILGVEPRGARGRTGARSIGPRRAGGWLRARRPRRENSHSWDRRCAGLARRGSARPRCDRRRRRTG
jgi:phenylpropionate dioxygenase-like ring-hydroxylating dioxygenase large terminal subunit